MRRSISRFMLMTGILTGCNYLVYAASVSESQSATSKNKPNASTTVIKLDPSSDVAPSGIANPDRLETYNRAAFKMNETLDRNAVRPTAVAYVTYVPDPVRYVLQSFFNNLRDFVTLGNDILQLQGQDSMHNVMRISINSTIGILGMIDISSSMGLKQHTNTFGKTMQTYGWTHSSYFVVPGLGPSTVRDSIGMIPDALFNPTWWIFSDPYISIGLFAVNAIDKRSKYLDYDQILYTSIDPYTTMRDAYLQSSGEKIPTDSTNSNLDIDSIIDDDSAPAPTTNGASKPKPAADTGGIIKPKPTQPQQQPDAGANYDVEPLLN